MSLACKGGGALACELENMQSACSLIESPNYSLLGAHMVAWLVAGQQVHRAAARQGVEGDCAGTALSLLPGFLFSRSPLADAPACCPLQELVARQHRLQEGGWCSLSVDKRGCLWQAVAQEWGQGGCHRDSRCRPLLCLGRTRRPLPKLWVQ